MSRTSPSAALMFCIAGGNHAQFGDYGEQAGDGKAEIALQEQQRRTIEEIKGFLKWTTGS